MSQGIGKVRDIENLVMGFKFMSLPLKRTLKYIINSQLENVSQVVEAEILRNIYNIYNIFGYFHSEELFRNGRLIFRDDNEIIFNSIVGPNCHQSELILFNGCTICKGDQSTYIMLKNNETPDSVKKICHSFDFNKLVEDAVTPPEVSILMNMGYYPSQIEKVLQLIR